MHNYKFTTFFNIKYRLYLKSFEKTGVLVYKYFYRIHPNVASQNAVIKSRGCEALIKMVQAQLQAHELDADNLNTDGTYTAPTLEQLKTEGYIETTSCPGGKTLIINPTTGKVEES